MTLRKLVAHRAHPTYKSLAQEIYECGHTKSVKPQELGVINETENRCVKCIKGMAIEVSSSDIKTIQATDTSKMQIIERLYQCLNYHLTVTEKSRGSLQGNLASVDLAIKDAHNVLKDAGFIMDISCKPKELLRIGAKSDRSKEASEQISFRNNKY
ncbi:hypothetical protein MNBD_GAMMA22-1352 [hydrothermal vent metagenome]|uniref:Uncharacterized protein n=1 Tax=hydrothermal vent metagenome TaxID=652676 RepID=A0A3B1A474_9ZZZZ